MTGTGPTCLLPLQPHDAEGPVFREPWEAQAFAMTLRLHEAGHFTWAEWASALSAQITAAQAAGDPDLGDTYYTHWLAALEALVARKGIASRTEQVARKEAWRVAAERAPHGEPIALDAAIRAGEVGRDG
ncbi:MAG: nitrile hydratase accessory protein [Ectothiorhodospiraceae bacterium]|nr:nitrile hydratase accessory protein [Chromatiales bacterium]MCP5156453.1 nitrile hydratase accessory protein [Ectothiorhodospiraceae bacterium]